MKAPKILPWVAKKAGISDELALKLWRRAIGEAEQLSGRMEGSEYNGLVVERFLSLVEDESTATLPEGLTPAPRLTWMWRHHTRLSLLTLMATQHTYRFWQTTWQKLYEPRKAA